MSPPFIGYSGWTGHANLGDEAVFDGVKALFGEYKVLSVTLGAPVRVGERVRRRRTPLKALVLGGGTLINQSERWLWDVEEAVSRGIPVFCLGTGVASEEFWRKHPEAKKGQCLDRWAALLTEFAFVGVRGPMSKMTLESVGVSSEITGDSALALAPDQGPQRDFRGRVGLNVSWGTDGHIMHGDPETLIRTLAEGVRILVDSGLSVTVLPMWSEDVPPSRELVARVGHSGCRYREAFGSTQDYMAAIAGNDVFVGQKLHATIFATMQRIPAIMLEYRPKCLDFMMSIGMERFSVRTDAVDPRGLAEKVHELVDTRDRIACELDSKVLSYKEKQRNAAASLESVLM
ncbi:MAG: polysaccharide pyruvyl transferase family protein [Acidimicrobiales bacterium]